MRLTLCPRCKKSTLTEIGDGYYKCTSCGYTGLSTFDEDVFKKSK